MIDHFVKPLNEAKVHFWGHFQTGKNTPVDLFQGLLWYEHEGSM